VRITRRRLARQVAKSGIPKKHAKMVVAVVISAVMAGLEKSDKVSLTSSDNSIVLIAKKVSR